MKTNFKKFAVIAVAVAALAACKKEQSANQNPMQVAVTYKITDRMQVNNEDGKPRLENTLAVIDGETIALSGEALSSGQITLKNTGRKDLVLNVVDNTGGKLTLAQNYAATAGLASGNIYYALSSN